MPDLTEFLRRVGRSVLPRPLMGVASATLNHLHGCRQLGLAEYRRLRALEGDQPDGPLAEVWLPALVHPVSVRRGTSDATELIHTIVRGTYGPYTPPPGEGVRLVIDAGANIGDTAGWFLTRYPKATVVSLEPDTRNFAVLERNTAPYGERSVRLNAGLWPRAAKLRVVESESRTALSVEEVVDGGRFDCQAVSPTDLLTRTGANHIDIFKIDIEGAERQLFADSGADAWLARTDLILMEIHGPDEEAAVMTAVGRHGFRHAQHREVRVFIHPNRGRR